MRPSARPDFYSHKTARIVHIHAHDVKRGRTATCTRTDFAYPRNRQVAPVNRTVSVRSTCRPQGGYDTGSQFPKPHPCGAFSIVLVNIVDLGPQHFEPAVPLGAVAIGSSNRAHAHVGELGQRVSRGVRPAAKRCRAPILRERSRIYTKPALMRVGRRRTRRHDLVHQRYQKSRDR